MIILNLISHMIYSFLDIFSILFIFMKNTYYLALKTHLGGGDIKAILKTKTRYHKHLTLCVCTMLIY